MIKKMNGDGSFRSISMPEYSSLFNKNVYVKDAGDPSVKDVMRFLIIRRRIREDLMQQSESLRIK